MLEPRDMETHKRVPYSFGVERIHVFLFWQKRKNRGVTKLKLISWGVEYLLPPIFLHGLYNWCSTLQRCEAHEEVYQGKVYKSDGCYLPPAWRMVFKAAHTATRKKREQRHTMWETGGSIWYYFDIWLFYVEFYHIPWFFARSFNVLTEPLDSSCATTTMAFEVVMLLSFYWWHQEFSEIAGDEEVSFSTNERTCLQQIPLPLVPHN